jgi:hypothetical protein
MTSRSPGASQPPIPNPSVNRIVYPRLTIKSSLGGSNRAQSSNGATHI